jgi:hypothetical protein
MGMGRGFKKVPVDFVRKGHSGLRLGQYSSPPLAPIHPHLPPHPSTSLERFPTGHLMLWIQVFAG